MRNDRQEAEEREKVRSPVHVHPKRNETREEKERKEGRKKVQCPVRIRNVKARRYPSIHGSPNSSGFRQMVAHTNALHRPCETNQIPICATLCLEREE